jgi:alpha-tubulin suppressor-like RCC1 family protein
LSTGRQGSIVQIQVLENGCCDLVKTRVWAWGVNDYGQSATHDNCLRGAGSGHLVLPGDHTACRIHSTAIYVLENDGNIWSWGKTTQSMGNGGTQPA